MVCVCGCGGVEGVCVLRVCGVCLWLVWSGVCHGVCALRVCGLVQYVCCGGCSGCGIVECVRIESVYGGV